MSPMTLHVRIVSCLNAIVTGLRVVVTRLGLEVNEQRLQHRRRYEIFTFLFQRYDFCLRGTLLGTNAVRTYLVPC